MLRLILLCEEGQVRSLTARVVRTTTASSRAGWFQSSKMPGKLTKQLVVKCSEWIESNERRGGDSGVEVFLRLGTPCLSGVRNGAGKTLEVHKS